VSSVAVTDSKWNGSLFLHSDMMFEFYNNVRVEVSSINVNFHDQGSDPVGSTCGKILPPHLRSGSHTRL